MSIIIRDFTPADYPALVTIHNALYPNSPSIVADWQEADERREPQYKYRCWLAARDGQVVGMANYIQHPWDYDPRRFAVTVRVLPEQGGQGIGTRLYDTLLAGLAAFEPDDLRAAVQEDHPHALDFARSRGFVEFLREQRSALVLADFDPAPFTDLLAAQDGAITLRSFADLADDPLRDAHVHALDMTTMPDVPGMEDSTPLTLAQYRREVLESPRFSQSGSFVALNAAGEYVGLTTFWVDSASPQLHTGITAVLRDYRRRGIAAALKVRAIQWAQANGYTRIQTENADTNPMLQLNYRLGFRPEPARIRLKKTL